MKFAKKMLLSPRFNACRHFKPIPHPLKPDLMIEGVDETLLYLFKSNLMPIKFSFFAIKTPDTKHSVIFKARQNLNQDVFVMQTIKMIDRMWKSQNLDLNIRTYEILRVGESDSFIEFVPSASISSILKNFDDSLVQYFYHQSTHNKGHTLEKIHENFTRSLAGYCIITYFLGVGDRHLDNLMICEDGTMFHIDFTFIFGHDPKPFSRSPMKICKEMVDVFGGVGTVAFSAFLSMCFRAFFELKAQILPLTFWLFHASQLIDVGDGPDSLEECWKYVSVQNIRFFQKLNFVFNILNCY